MSEISEREARKIAFHTRLQNDGLTVDMTDPRDPKIISLEKLEQCRPNYIKKLEIETLAQIYGEDVLNPKDIGYIHTMHANCFLPRTKIKQDHFIHRNGPYSILLDAGNLECPTTGNVVRQPVPYGGKPRALLGYANTFAVKHNTPVIPLGRSFTDFVRMMTGSVSGGKKGNIKPWQTQLLALSAATIKLGFPTAADRRRTVKMDIADELEIWFSTDPNQKSLFPTELVLTDKYYNHLKDHAMPFDQRIASALVHDPMAFDIFMWLIYRAPKVRQANGVGIGYQALHTQFGQGYKLLKHFTPRFKEALAKAQRYYPDLKIRDIPQGIKLYSSPKLISETAVVHYLASKSK